MTGIAELLSYDPWLTVQMGHFVRTAAAAENPFDERLDCGEDFDYYLRLWSRYRCIKMPQPLFLNRRNAASTGPRSATPGQWRSAAQAAIARYCAALGFHADFEVAGERFRFHIENPFDTVQRSHLKRRFFEAQELDYLRGRLRAGGVIVEVGANVGNHVVYYARFLEPKKIVVIEPNPAVLGLLRKNLAANAVGCADLSLLGMAVGDRECRYEARTHDPNNLGATRLVESAHGSIRCAPLDSLIVEPVDFVKIDVEGMEQQVLDGAQALLRSSRPCCLVEVFRRQLDPFRAWIEANDYRVERVFDYVHAVNLYLEPR
jgi:FkbM family methyltransferase